MNKQTYFLQPSIASLPAREKERKWLAYRSKQKPKNQKQQKQLKQALAPTPVRPVSAPAARRTRMSFTNCLLSYAKAAIDPFDQAISEACIPDNNAMPSHKFSTYINATAQAGVQGVCIIGLNPWTMTAKDYGASPTHCDIPLIVSNGTYNSATIDFEKALLGTELDAYNSNSFYPVLQVGNQSMRLVGAAVEVYYTGPTLSQSGAVTVQQTAGLTYVPSGTTFASFRNDPRSRTCSVSKGARCYVAYQPISDDLLSYKPNTIYQPSANPTIANITGCYTPLVIAISGAAPGTSFQVKAIAHFEALYPGMGVTPSHSDPIGFPSFLSARSSITPSDDPSADLVSVLKKTASTIASNLSPYLPMAGAALGSAFGNPQLGAVVGSASKSVLDIILDGKSIPI